MKRIYSLLLFLFVGTATLLAQGFQSPGIRPSGYRGMVDIGGGPGFKTAEGGKDAVIEFSTTHGYQWNPFLFAGAGINVQYRPTGEVVFAPIYADLRVYLSDTKAAPFIDFRAGYSFFDEKGTYISPAVGVDFNLNKNLGLYVNAGYDMIVWNWKVDLPFGFGYESGTRRIDAITFRLGMNF